MSLDLLHVRPREVAFRNDHCLNCEQPRLAICVRSFDVVRAGILPVVPLGFIHRWYCTTCEKLTNRSYRVHYGHKVAAVFVLAWMTMAFWLIPASAFPDLAVLLWQGRIGTLPLLAWAWYRLRQEPREPGYKEKLAQVEPYASATCPFCGVLLNNVPTWHCPQCGLERK